LKTIVMVWFGRNHMPCAKYTMANSSANRRPSMVVNGLSRASPLNIGSS
jgi:hypothetical protein